MRVLQRHIDLYMLYVSRYQFYKMKLGMLNFPVSTASDFRG